MECGEVSIRSVSTGRWGLTWLVEDWKMEWKGREDLNDESAQLDLCHLPTVFTFLSLVPWKTKSVSHRLTLPWLVLGTWGQDTSKIKAIEQG